jgi:hypothetical protein
VLQARGQLDEAPGRRRGSDSDSGPNTLQNFPTLSQGNIFGGNLIVKGSISTNQSLIGKTLTIELYANGRCNPSATARGKRTSAASPASGSPATAASPTRGPVPPARDKVITATATSASGDTSEFSPCSQISRLSRP